MKKIFLALLISSATLPLSAQAQDAAMDWTGFYAGVHAGYGWGDKDWITSGGGNPQSHSENGILGGVQAGYNVQKDNFVFGVEGDFSFSGIDGGTSWTAGGRNAGPRNITADINWIASIAARAGVAMDSTLIYAKGGVAWADEDYTHLSADGPRWASETRNGWLIGAGVEHAYSNGWNLKIEYNYMDFGSGNVTFQHATMNDSILSLDQKVSVIKIGMNYRF